MNIQECDIMNKICQSGYVNQRRLSEDTGYSLGKVNQSLAALVKDGYLTASYQPTEKTWETVEQRRPKRAVILAAGYGIRMVPINREVPKGLIEIGGEPLIERLIRQLKETGIQEICVVVGFMKEQYEYLIDEFGVRLIVNEAYARLNNLHSLRLAEAYLSNAYILPCDVWCQENPFSQQELYSWYMVSDESSEESTVRVNRKLELVEIDGEENGNTMVGIAYLLEEDARLLRERMLEMDGKKAFANEFWESALMQKGKMRIAPRIVQADQVREINTYEQLRALDEGSRQLESRVLTGIGEILACGVHEIEGIRILKKGMTNRSFIFSLRGKRYIMRIPGEGTAQLINRRQEYQVYQAIRSLQICDPVCYMDPENGYKLTEFVENARCCDPTDPEDVKACMQVLRRFHEKELVVDHTFDIFERIGYYESLWEGEPSCYRDHSQTKANIFELKGWLDQQPHRWCLCHIDSVPDNFLITETEIRLIDWEYAGMQDPDVDLAMFILYSLYDREQADQLIDAYYTEGCPPQVRLKIYAYVACCGLLWSDWCEVKRRDGVEFGEYSLRQYRYAKEYSRYVRELSPEITGGRIDENR